MVGKSYAVSCWMKCPFVNISNEMEYSSPASLIIVTAEHMLAVTKAIALMAVPIR